MDNSGQFLYHRILQVGLKPDLQQIDSGNELWKAQKYSRSLCFHDAPLFLLIDVPLQYPPVYRL